MLKGLKDKVAVVTGGSNGIGKSCVERLCVEGCKVTFSGISDAGFETEKEFLKAGYDVHFVKGNIGEEETCKTIVEETIKKWGKLNYLVNNAFSFTAKGINAERKDWKIVMDCGPVAYATMAYYAGPYMLEQGGGAIVNMSSISAHISQPDRWTYNTAKGAVTQLTRCMALDLAPKIRVNSVSPAWIWTREVAKAANFDREKWEPVWGKFHMLRRLGEDYEVASPVAFLLSDEASFITSTDLFVDGGYLGMGSEGLGESSAFAGSV